MVSTAPQQASVVPQVAGLVLLQAVLANPQFQQTLRSAAMGAAARNVYLPLPMPAQPQLQQQLPIPLGAVMNAIAQLASQSMTEMTENTAEEAPPVPAYLIDEDGEYVVDPANAEDRAALVAHLFRVNAEAIRGGESDEAIETDDSEAWAREAGFIL
jgi:hypothetical protein